MVSRVSTALTAGELGARGEGAVRLEGLEAQVAMARHDRGGLSMNRERSVTGMASSATSSSKRSTARLIAGFPFCV